MTQIYPSIAGGVQQDYSLSIFSSTISLLLSSWSMTGQVASKSHSHTETGSTYFPKSFGGRVEHWLLTRRRAAPLGLVTFSISPLNLLLIIEKAWQAAGEGEFRTLQTTLLLSACLIRLVELTEDRLGLELISVRRWGKAAKLSCIFLKNGW